MSGDVLVLSWSQSGQLEAVSTAFTEPFVRAGYAVHHARLQPVTPFPFPWKVHTFFGEFPETVSGRPRPIYPLNLPDRDWAMIVIVAQVWFLSPSQPFAAFLQSPDAAVLRGRRVITVMSCRNMWVSGWRKLVLGVERLGGHVTDRVVATHSGAVFASYFSTLAWMLTGRRDAIKALPMAGLGADTFDRLGVWGTHAAGALATAPARTPLLAGVETASISPAHAFGEQLVEPIFRLLARIIGTLSAHGSALRAMFAVVMLGFILSCVFGLLVPCVVTERLARRWISPWLQGLSRLPVTA